MMQKLNEIPDKNPFKVPENYFADVNKKIISVTSGYDKDIKKIGLYSRLRPYMLIAASVTGFIILSYTAVKLLVPNSMTSLVSEAISEEYPESFINDIDIFTLEENVASMVSSEEGSEANKKDIIDYLLLDNIEISDIYEQL